jgi:hypothetical protein
MTTPRDPDSILAAWLEEGPSALPEPTKRAIAVNTRTMNQRRHRIWLPQRRLSMNPLARMAVAAVVIAVTIGGAVYVLAPPNGVVGGPPAASPTPTVSPSPRATPTPVATVAPPPSPAILATDGFVYPGAYVPAFDPPMTFTIDKEVQHNCAPNFRCRGSIDANLSGWLDLEFGLPRIEASIVRVDKVNDPAHSGRLIDPPADLAAWIASRPGLTVVSQESTKVGGLAATRLDIQIGNTDLGLGPIPGVTDPGLGYGASTDYRLFVVSVHGRPVLISLRAEDGSIAEIQPLVDSIVWN